MRNTLSARWNGRSCLPGWLIKGLAHASSEPTPVLLEDLPLSLLRDPVMQHLGPGWVQEAKVLEAATGTCDAKFWHPARASVKV